MKARLFVLFLLFAGPAVAQPTISIVAAENFYGDVAKQIAGPQAKVSSILTNPDQDPHLFEASPSVARQLSAADIVVYNGVDYDPWMHKLVTATRAKQRDVIVVGDLMHRTSGANPHIWYDPPTMSTYANGLAARLAARDPAHRQEYQQRLQAFLASLEPLSAKIAAMQDRFNGIPVTATEPVFGYMAAALGFSMRNERFQFAIMNGTEPRPSDVAAFQNDLRKQAVRLLIYNSQAAGPAAQRMIGIARQANIPVIGVAETKPAGSTYQDWMMETLDKVERALSSS